MEWIRRNLRYTPDQRALLVWDSLRGHLKNAVKDLLVRWNVEVAVIPGGFAPVLQPLDKCINKPFKTKVRSQYQTWTVNGLFTLGVPKFWQKLPKKKQIFLEKNRAPYNWETTVLYGTNNRLRVHFTEMVAGLPQKLNNLICQCTVAIKVH